jgi:hypothetical protein
MEQPVFTKTCVVGPPMLTLILGEFVFLVLFAVKTEATLVELIDERISNVCGQQEYNDTDGETRCSYEELLEYFVTFYSPCKKGGEFHHSEED